MHDLNVRRHSVALGTAAADSSKGHCWQARRCMFKQQTTNRANRGKACADTLLEDPVPPGPALPGPAMPGPALLVASSWLMLAVCCSAAPSAAVLSCKPGMLVNWYCLHCGNLRTSGCCAQGLLQKQRCFSCAVKVMQVGHDREQYACHDVRYGYQLLQHYAMAWQPLQHMPKAIALISGPMGHGT